MLSYNGRPDAGRRQTDTGGITGPPCSGPGGRILPAAAGPLSLRVATATQGCLHAAAVVFVRNIGGSSATFFVLPVCGDQLAHAHSCPKIMPDRCRPEYRACHREDGVFAAVRPGPGDGHVRSVRSYQVRSFEVMLAQASSDDGKQVVFSSMPADADRQRDQLRGVLHGLGVTSGTPVTVLSDGAEGPRSLGEAACVGPTRMCWTGSTCRRASSTLPRQP